MITGNIYQQEDLEVYPKALSRALDYLQKNDLTTHQPGRFPLDGERLILQVIDLETAPRDHQRPEVHRKYVDLQFLAKGRERIHYYPDLGDNLVEEELLAERDILFYHQNPNAAEQAIEMIVGSYAVFFPWDVHVPGVMAAEGSQPIRKIVLKILLEDFGLDLPTIERM